MSTTTTVELPLDKIAVKDGFNARVIANGDLDGLKTSIERKGILMPLIVGPVDQKGRHQLIAGERRLRCAKALKLAAVPAIVRDQDDALEVTALENMQREQLNPIEEGRAFRALIDGGYTEEGAAEAVSVRVDTVRNRLALLRLPEKVQGAIVSGDMLVSEGVKLALTITLIPPLGAAIEANVADKKTGKEGLRSLCANPGWYVPKMLEGIPGVYSPHGVKLADLPQELLAPHAEKLKEVNTAYQESYYGGRGKLDTLRIPEAAAKRAAALGQVVEIGRREYIVDDGYEFLKDAMPDVLKAEIRNYKKSKSNHSTGAASSGASDEAEKAKKRKEREQAKELAVEARAINLKFGERLTTTLARVDLSVDVARFLALHCLSSHNLYGGGSVNEQVAALAARGLALVYPEWQTTEQLKSGKIKHHYLGDAMASEREELDKRFWQWFDEAKTAEEILGKLFTAYAAAEYGLNQAKEAQSKRAYFHWSAARSKQAGEALGRIVKEALPPALVAFRKKHRVSR